MLNNENCVACCLTVLQLTYCVAIILSPTEYPRKWDVSPSRVLDKTECFTSARVEKCTKHSSERCIQPKRLPFLWDLISILKTGLSLSMQNVTLRSSDFSSGRTDVNSHDWSPASFIRPASFLSHASRGHD